SISECGVSMADFEKTLPDLVLAAASDMAIKTNPRYALKDEFIELFVSSYAPRKIERKVESESK
ncbi:MAG: hypothetical protein K8F91_14175, partial [Candidatus Obscuribacterales bacterium]|nr:hypothetical protein [Candidatus Obscuribacterales bacterium]